MVNNNHFNLQLDTTAPTGSITAPAYSTAANITVSLSASSELSTSDVKYMKVTLTGKKSGTVGGTWEAYATSKTLTVTSEDTYTATVQFMDDVGNTSSVYTATNKTNYDKTAPSISTFTVVDPSPVSGQPSDETNTLSNTITINGSDSGTDANATPSGIQYYVVSCSAFAKDYQLTPNSGTQYSGTVDFVAGTAQGSYTISAYPIDYAGNKGTTKTVTLYYDDPSSEGVPTLKIVKGGTTTSIVNGYTNSSSISATIGFVKESGESTYHIVGYKLWETGTTEPSSYTAVTRGDASANVSKTFVSGEGKVTWNAKVIDDVGNESSAVSASFTYDKTLPVGTFSVDKTRISATGDTTTATITYGVYDANISSWTISCNGTAIKSGTSSVGSYSSGSWSSLSTLAITSATSGMKEGANTITFSATDKAGNALATQTVTVTLDTSAPVGTFLTPTNVWYSKTGDNVWDKATTVHMSCTKACSGYFWFSKSATDTSVPAGWATAVTISKKTGSEYNNVSSESIYGNVSGYPYESAAKIYIHAKLIDDVGNVSYAHSSEFNFDCSAPATPTVTWSQKAYGSTAASATVQCSSDDTYSKIAWFKIDSYVDDEASAVSINPSTTDWVSVGTGSITSGIVQALTLTSTEGHKKIVCYVKDAAGNISSASNAVCTELDMTKPTGALVLYVKGTSTVKPARSNMSAVDAVITLTDDSITDHDSGMYKIWGDISGEATTESAAQWVSFSTGGSAQIKLSLTCSSGDGTKIFNARVKDNAGNESDVYTAQFIYDTTAPYVYAKSDYAKISKSSAARWSSANTEISGTACNKVIATACIVDTETGTTLSDQTWTEWKAVAYKDEAAAKAGSASDAAIEGCSGSSSVGQATNITMTITGENFEKALNGGTAVTDHSMDGAHIVVVYIKDEAGTWSKAASFAA